MVEAEEAPKRRTKVRDFVRLSTNSWWCPFDDTAMPRGAVPPQNKCSTCGYEYKP